MQYSKKVIKHFQNPRNQGVIKNADAVGEAGNLKCGDIMKIYLKIENRKQKTENRKTVNDSSPFIKGGWGDLKKFVIKDIKFETLGCAAAIAVSSALTDMVKGKTLNEALKLTKDKIIKDLGGLPPVKVHCSMLGLEALHRAIKNYELRIMN